jgi:hypothetical protein
MKTKVRLIIEIVLFMCLLHVANAEQINNDGKQLVAEPEVQEQFEQTTSILLRHWKKQASEEDVMKSIEKLKSTQSNIAEIIPQLILYRVTIIKDEKKYHATMIIGSFLIKSVSDTNIIEAVAMYLETDNPTVYDETREILDGIRGNSKIAEGYYQPFEAYLTARKYDPPKALIEYMYSGLPDEALKSLILSLVNDNDKAKTNLIESAEIIRSDSKAKKHRLSKPLPPINTNVTNALSNFSKRPEWWIQLYVAEKIKKNPELSTPELMKQLKKSDNTAVLDVVHEIEKNNKYENKSKIPVQESE